MCSFGVHAWDPRESRESPEEILMPGEMGPSPVNTRGRGVPLCLELSNNILYDVSPFCRTQNITYQAEQRNVKPVEDYHHYTLLEYRIYD